MESIFRFVLGTIGLVLGAVGGLYLTIYSAKPIHDLIWASDMNGDSGYFAVLVVLPLFITLGATVGVSLVCCLFSPSPWTTLVRMAAYMSGIVVGMAFGFFLAVGVGKVIHSSVFLLVISLTLGGAIGGGL